MSKCEQSSKLATDASRIHLLPCFFTAGNLFFGFLAVIRCIQARYGVDHSDLSIHYYTQSVWLILFACICDVFDGFAARLSGTESLFGKEFDSLADIISFGVAPAFLVFCLILSPTEGYPFFRQVGWLISFIYLLCGAVRLARFNVLTSSAVDKDDKPAKGFIGLPIPAAAGTIASLALVINQFDIQRWALILPALMLLIAWLMVSHIPYPSLKSLNWQSEMRFWNFIIFVILAATLFIFGYLGLLMIFLGYIAFGLLRYFKLLKSDLSQ